MASASSHRTVDTNGFYEIVDNPISKSGVFDYLGASIGHYYLPNGERKEIPTEDFGHPFKVFRSDEELGSQKTIDSFKLMPWFDDHEMVGSKGIPAEEKGVEGVIGEKVYFQSHQLLGNLKLFSQDMAEKIQKGKTHLSIGYEDRKIYNPGVHKGEAYDFLQTNIIGNHIALVDAGRCGADVAVLDAADKNGRSEMSNIEKEAVLDRVSKAEDALSTVMDKMEKMEKSHAKDKEERPDKEDKKDMKEEKSEKDTKDKKDMKEKESKKEKSEDEKEDNNKSEDEAAEGSEAMALLRKIRAILGGGKGDNKETKESKKDKSEDNKERGYAMDSSEIAIMQRKLNSLLAKDEKQSEIVSYQKKMTLFDDLSAHVGTFDHADMNLNEMSKYGVKKLGLECEDGVEVPVLRTYLNTAPKIDYSASYAFDSSDNSNSIKAMAQGKA